MKVGWGKHCRRGYDYLWSDEYIRITYLSHEKKPAWSIIFLKSFNNSVILWHIGTQKTSVSRSSIRARLLVFNDSPKFQHKMTDLQSKNALDTSTTPFRSRIAVCIWTLFAESGITLRCYSPSSAVLILVVTVDNLNHIITSVQRLMTSKIWRYNLSSVGLIMQLILYVITNFTTLHQGSSNMNLHFDKERCVQGYIKVIRLSADLRR